MPSKLPRDHCPVTWCDEGTRPHDRHMGYLGSWIGTAPGNGRRAVTAQVVIYGRTKTSPTPALVLVDSAPGIRELQCDLEWSQAHGLTTSLCAAHKKFGPHLRPSET